MLNLSHFHVNGTRQTKQCGLVRIIQKNETHMAHIRKQPNQMALTVAFVVCEATELRV